jgi:hypothetical protein
MAKKITKQQLINQLEHTKNNYILGLAAFSMFDSGLTNQQLAHHAAAFGEYTITFAQVVTLLQNPKDREIVLREFGKMLMRTLIKESFEHIKDYCEKTDQYIPFKAQSWYEFARMIRNFLSHNCKFEFNKYDKDRLPITWGKKAITIDLDNKSPDIRFFSYVETWELFQEFTIFVTNDLE